MTQITTTARIRLIYQSGDLAALAIDLLRMALAGIWTELEKDNPNLEDCQTIASEALLLTIEHASGKILSGSTGLESWEEAKERFLEKK